MKLYWTVEPRGVIVLRDPHTAPRAHVGPRIAGDGYATTILEPGMPGCGPFRFRTQAALWAQDYIKRELFADAEFDVIPAEPGRSSEQQELFVA